MKLTVSVVLFHELYQIGIWLVTLTLHCGMPVSYTHLDVYKRQAQTIEALHNAGLNCKIMVGGAVLTPEYAKTIGADFYAKDAKQSADIAKEVLG